MQVKGLAEMTNQSSELREPEREQDHLRPPPSSPQNVMPGRYSNLSKIKRFEVANFVSFFFPSFQSDGSSSTTNTNAKRSKSDRCSPSPTRHHHQQQHQMPSSRKTPDEFYDKTRHQRSGEQYLPTSLPNRSNSPSTHAAHSHQSIHHHLSQSAQRQQVFIIIHFL